MVLPGEQKHIPQTGIEHMEEAHLIGAQNLHASQGGSLVNSLLSTQPCVPEFNPWSPCPRSGVVARICNSITGVAELGRSQWHGSSRFSETSSQKLIKEPEINLWPPHRGTYTYICAHEHIPKNSQL